MTKITLAQTNHLAKQLLKDYNIDAESLSGGDLINLINLLYTYQWTHPYAQIERDFTNDFQQTLRQDL